MIPALLHRFVRPVSAATRRALALAFVVTMVSPATVPSLHAQPLFKNDGVLKVTITGNIRDLLRERDSTKLEWYGASFDYVSGDSTVSVPVELRARGHFRRQRNNCEFPPLFVRGAKEVIEGTELQGNQRVKLVTPCRPSNDDYRQYILMEYGLYAAYAMMHPIHPRTRLAEITYVDSAARVKPMTVTAFFLETDNETAKEHKLTLQEELKGARFRDMDPATLQSLSLFELMVGGADWSLGGLHNIYLLQDSIGVFFPVAYDWDFAGLVNARYATPAPILPIKKVTERHYMGPCYTAEEWKPTLDLYRSKREALDGLWATIPDLSPAKQKQATDYLGSFWKMVDNPRDFERMTKTCRPQGN